MLAQPVNKLQFISQQSERDSSCLMSRKGFDCRVAALVKFNLFKLPKA